MNYDRRRASQAGFTLVEMMVVVAIIAVLVAVLVPNFMRARAQAQTSSCMMNLKSIATALELYQTDNAQYPTASKTSVNSNDSNLFPYINQVPVDPAAAKNAFYEYSTTNPTAGNASYSIICPGLHDTATLQKIDPSTTNQHIQYNSSGGFTTAATQ